MTTTKKANWTHKVVKMQRGIQGEWFAHRTAATFATEADALHYANEFACEQGEAGVVGTKITVWTRKGSCCIASIDVTKLAVVK